MSSPLPQIVFVASLPHSGSTLVDFLLGVHPRVISCGEVQGALTRLASGRAFPRCTCGSTVSDCVIWGPLQRKFEEKIAFTRKEQYEFFLKTVKQVYGNDIRVVDSSKDFESLLFLRQEFGIEPKVLFVIRDMRSYAISQLDRNRRRKEFNHRSFFAFNVWSWFRHTRALENSLSKGGFQTFRFGYEELALRYQTLLPKICDFLDIDFREEMLVPANNQTSHIISGNSWVQHPDFRKTIQYDYRWFSRKEVFLGALAMLPLMRFNRSRVYSNVKVESTDRSAET